MSDKKPAIYAASGLTNVTALGPSSSFQLPNSSSIPEFEPINLSDFDPQIIGTFEMDAGEFERLLKPIWGYVKIGPHLFVVPDEPTQNADGTRTIRMRKLEPDTVAFKMAARAWWESVTRGKTRD